MKDRMFYIYMVSSFQNTKKKLLQKLKKNKLRKDIDLGKKSMIENKALLGQQK